MSMPVDKIKEACRNFDSNNQESRENLESMISNFVESKISLNCGVFSSIELFKTFCKGLRSNDTIKTLNISNNRINDEGAKEISKLIENNKTITNLCLTNTNISNKGFKSILKALENNYTITGISSELCFSLDGNDEELYSKIKELTHRNSNLARAQARYPVEECIGDLMILSPAFQGQFNSKINKEVASYIGPLSAYKAHTNRWQVVKDDRNSSRGEALTNFVKRHKANIHRREYEYGNEK